MDELKEEIKQLRVEVKELTRQIQILANTCGRMDEHITFVNGVYTTARQPLDFVFTRVNRLMGSADNHELPAIENSRQ